MPRNISFSMTTDQVRNRTKTVTRRVGWWYLKAGTILNACVKCMGLKKGEKPERICQIRVVDVWQEPLYGLTDSTQFPEYGKSEVEKEGFPDMSPREFVTMFCKSHKGCTKNSLVTRIEFEYLENA